MGATLQDAGTGELGTKLEWFGAGIKARQGRGGCNGGAQRAPLPTSGVLHRTSLRTARKLQFHRITQCQHHV